MTATQGMRGPGADFDPAGILTGDAERDRRNVGIVLAMVQELYGPLELGMVLRHALDRAIEVTGAQRAIVLTEDEDGGGLTVRMGRTADGADLPDGERFSRTVVNKVWDSSESFLTIDAADQSAAALGQSILDLRLLSIMAAPLPTKDGGNLGVLYVDSTVQTKEFNKADFQVFKAIGGLVAVAVENAWLREQEKEKERMARDLAVARDIQHSLLPKQLPELERFDLAAVGRPCEETSGDYYDCIRLPSGQVALVVGDVSGHGLGSALYMVSTRALLHSLLRTHPGPLQVIESLNAFLERDMPDSAFMSMFLGILDPDTGRLQYVSAGHNPPLLLRQNGTVELLGKTGPVLSILAPAPYTLSDPIQLDSGDSLVLYTDGFFEAHDEANEIYGEDRFGDSARRHAEATPEAEGMLQGMLADLMTFVGSRPLDDDVTALVVRSL